MRVYACMRAFAWLNNMCVCVRECVGVGVFVKEIQNLPIDGETDNEK